MDYASSHEVVSFLVDPAAESAASLSFAEYMYFCTTENVSACAYLSLLERHKERAKRERVSGKTVSRVCCHPRSRLLLTYQDFGKIDAGFSVNRDFTHMR